MTWLAWWSLDDPFGFLKANLDYQEYTQKLGFAIIFFGNLQKEIVNQLLNLNSYQILLKNSCEDFLHTSTTKIYIHKKNRLEVELLCNWSLTSKVVRGK
jgi:hypothetical protein